MKPPASSSSAALTLFAVNNGYFDDIEVKKALSAEKSMRDHIKNKYGSLVKTMEDKKDLSPEDEKALKAAIEDWKKNAPEAAVATPAKAEAARAKPKAG
jgi:F0F1-type ATP synthase alpha subunit